jgi:hypothetical protein
MLMFLFKFTCEGGTHFSLFVLYRLLDKIFSAFGVEQGKVVRGGEDVGNVLSLITGIIAAGLYGNVGIGKYPIGGKQSFFIDNHLPTEVVCVNILEGGPMLMTLKGRIIWTSASLLFVFMSKFT